MNASAPTYARADRGPSAGVRRARAEGPAHRYALPSVREMTPAETEAQRRLVRASLLAKPV